jgi:hypothetical protein
MMQNGAVPHQNLVIVDSIDFLRLAATHSQHVGILLFAGWFLLIDSQKTTSLSSSEPCLTATACDPKEGSKATCDRKKGSPVLDLVISILVRLA